MNEQTTRMKSDPGPVHYQYRTVVVGLFILLPVLLIALFVAYQLVQFGYLERWVHIEVHFDEVYNLQQAADVIYRGVSIGVVDRITLDQADFVKVRLKIRQKNFPLIQQGCSAQLVQKNFPIGDWQIRLTRDKNSTFVLSENAVMPVREPLTLDILLVRLETLLSALTEIATEMKTGQGIIGQLLSDQTIPADIGTLRTQMKGLLGQVDLLLRKADTTLGSTHNMVGHMDEFFRHGTDTVDYVEEIARDAAPLITKIDRLIDHFDQLTSDLQGLPPDLEEAIQGMKRDLTEAEILLKALQKHWLLRKAVQKTIENDTPSNHHSQDPSDPPP
ncbi:MCE family protein [bacterium]|nr:MCE family protein [bacterium]